MMGNFETNCGGVVMNNVFVLEKNESEKLIETAVNKQIPAILSYMSKNKWHVSKILITGLGEKKLIIECIQDNHKRQPINIQEGQPVGISFKYSYGKFLFDTTVLSLEPSSDPHHGGSIALDYPTCIEAIQRRSYFRVIVPKAMKVNAALWHRISKTSTPEIPHEYFEGQLMDISAGGLMVALPQTSLKPDFRKGQFIGMRFTPLPYETPIIFNAQIRNILPTADNSALCLGLQIVGLEASREGQQTLGRIADIVEKYHQINEGKMSIASKKPATIQPTAHS